MSIINNRGDGKMEEAKSRKTLTTGAAAKRIGLNSKTLRRWVDTNKVEGFKSATGLRYVYEDALEEIIRSKQP
jgi:transposase-like protein